MALKCFKIEKLIRDYLPDIMRKNKINVCERILEKNEFIEKLKDKLEEEAIEVKNAKNLNDLTEELADLLEVIYALSKATEISLNDIEKIRLTKKKEKGGFEKKIYGHFIEIDETNPLINSFESKEKYPTMELINNNQIV